MKWAAKLQTEHDVRSSFFLRLDLRNESVGPRRGSGAAESLIHMSDRDFKPLSHAACRLNATARPTSDLDSAIRA